MSDASPHACRLAMQALASRAALQGARARMLEHELRRSILSREEEEDEEDADSDDEDDEVQPCVHCRQECVV